VKLKLQRIGQLNEASLALHKPAVFYGPNGSGKTTVARALGLAVRLLTGGEVKSAEALALISLGADTGRISLGNYEIELTRRPRGAVAVRIVRTDKAEVLYEREVSGVIATHLSERPPVDVLLRVRLTDVSVVGGVVGGEVRALTLADLAMPSVVTLWGVKEEGAVRMDEYAGYINEVNRILWAITDHELVAAEGRLYCRSDGAHFDEESTAAGVQRVALIAASYVLAKRLKSQGASPLLFVENFETALHLDYVSAVFKFLASSEIPTVVETHSGLVLRAAVLKQLDYYIFAEGTVTKDLKRLELFWREVRTMTEIV
jgi:energy-coupling factor transporter ATP-binding protein EcfA2